MITLSWSIIGIYLGLLAGMCIFGLHRLRLFQLSCTPAPLAALFTPKTTPTVTVQLPVFNEPLVIERLIDAVGRIDWPRGTIEVQVLDDSDDGITTARARARVAHWQQRGLDIQIIRRANRTGYKAGALAHGLKTARGDFIAIFDADFVVPTDFLQRVMPSFFVIGSKRIGMVQARWGHLNRNQSLLTRLQALLLDGHFILEHTARYHGGRFFNFNGTAGVWDRRCIDEAGGWAHDTITEDVDLSYRAQLAGWRFVYLPDVVVPAELPIGVPAFLTQQHRWSKGTIQTARKLLSRILSSPTPRPVRIEATLHLLGPVGYPMLFLLALLLPPSIVARSAIGNGIALWLDLLTLTLTTGSLFLFFGTALRRIGGPWVRRLWQIPAMMALGVGIAPAQTAAVIEGCFSSNVDFVRTPKMGDLSSTPGWSVGTPDRPAVRWITAGIALYLTAATVGAAAAAHWPSLPFLLLFATGMSAVAVSLFMPARPQRHRQAVAAAERDAAPAAR